MNINKLLFITQWQPPDAAFYIVKTELYLQ